MKKWTNQVVGKQTKQEMEMETDRDGGGKKRDMFIFVYEYDLDELISILPSRMSLDVCL